MDPLMPLIAKVFRTTRNTTDRLTEKEPVTFHSEDKEGAIVLVDPQKHFQTIEGFGGAFTEAAAHTFYKLSPDLRNQILKAYFDPEEGIRYSFCRTHINSCDFSLSNYAYTEVPGDVDLRHFSIEHDRHELIPMIREAMEKVGPTFKLLASPWSPPAWMKTNGQMNHGGKLKSEYRQAWANYLVRFIAEYEEEGLPIWGVTVQNEPLATQVWDSCIYTAEEERDFVREYLGPAFENNGLLGKVKLLIWDHNRDLLYERAKVVYDDPEASRYVWGAAFHWYVGDHFNNVQVTHDAFPEKYLLFSEGCQEGGPHYDDWDVGERYGHSMLQDLSHWTTAWIDWNLLLDSRGGPNHGGNYCSAPVMADYIKGTIYFHNSFYYIGQISRFVQPGARRVVSCSSLDHLETAAFQNPDGNLVAVVMNRSEDDLPFSLKYNGQAARINAPAHSISTFCLKNN